MKAYTFLGNVSGPIESTYGTFLYVPGEEVVLYDNFHDRPRLVHCLEDSELVKKFSEMVNARKGFDMGISELEIEDSKIRELINDSRTSNELRKKAEESFSDITRTTGDLESCINWYDENKKSLKEEHMGDYVLIHGKRVVVADSDISVVKKAIASLPDGNHIMVHFSKEDPRPLPLKIEIVN